MSKEFETKQIYRVFHTNGNKITEAFFESKKEARQYTDMMNAIAGAEDYRLNIWSWEMKIEK